MATKNITVAVTDDVYRAARVSAAQRGTSVSALVGDFLRSLAGAGSSDFDELEDRQREIAARVKEFRAGDRLDREALHERAVR